VPPLASRSATAGWKVVRRAAVTTATSDGIDRLEPCEDWRPYVVAAIPGHWVPTERKTGVKDAEVITARLVRDERGWLGLAG
jgi:hypothetical protein